MALKHSIRNMNCVFLCLNLWWITLRKRNTYGVFALSFDDILMLFISQLETLWHEI